MPKFFQCFVSFKLIQTNINYLENIYLKKIYIYILKKKESRGEEDGEKSYGKIVIIAITMLFDK